MIFLDESNSNGRNYGGDQIRWLDVQNARPTIKHGYVEVHVAATNN